MENSLYYRDVYLLPKFSNLESRSHADTSCYLGNFKFKLPIVPSNMKSVIDEKWSKWLSENQYFYVMHRFDEINVPFVRRANREEWRIVSISIGVNEESKKEIIKCKSENLRIDYFTIDVAHGHSLKVKEMISFIKDIYPDSYLIAGNTATPESTLDLEKWGADATKCCIGSGMACSTKMKTGFHVPPFSCVLECADVAKKPIIADGGIEHYGDIAKALVAGGTMVMCGGLFASCNDSPAPHVNGKKIYFGNASERAKGENKHVEGFELGLSPDVNLEQKLKEIKEALQSSISYAGGTDLSCFNSVEYIVKK
jgi:GMP reductase